LEDATKLSIVQLVSRNIFDHTTMKDSSSARLRAVTRHFYVLLISTTTSKVPILVFETTFVTDQGAVKAS
jgi:hypothetical protein